mmetsp:Transcript_7536/g.27677  ORF Transcript_7536/g.27677 Transcript_7536/m.27677 type:complete len:812 (+) Transcript_7536:191-2626(+)
MVARSAARAALVPLLLCLCYPEHVQAQDPASSAAYVLPPLDLWLGITDAQGIASIYFKTNFPDGDGASVESSLTIGAMHFVVKDYGTVGLATPPVLPPLLTIVPEQGLLEELGYAVVSAPYGGEVFALPPATGGSTFNASSYNSETTLLLSLSVGPELAGHVLCMDIVTILDNQGAAVENILTCGAAATPPPPPPPQATEYAFLEVSKPTATNHVVVYVASDLPITAFHFTMSFKVPTADGSGDYVATGETSYLGDVIEVFGGAAGDAKFALNVVESGQTVVAVMTNAGEPVVTSGKMTLLCVLLLDGLPSPDVEVCVESPEVLSTAGIPVTTIDVKCGLPILSPYDPATASPPQTPTPPPVQAGGTNSSSSDAPPSQEQPPPSFDNPAPIIFELPMEDVLGDGDDESSSGNLGILLGVIFASIGLLLVVLVAALCCYRRRVRETNTKMHYYSNHVATLAVDQVAPWKAEGYLEEEDNEGIHSDTMLKGFELASKVLQEELPAAGLAQSQQDDEQSHYHHHNDSAGDAAIVVIEEESSSRSGGSGERQQLVVVCDSSDGEDGSAAAPQDPTTARVLPAEDEELLAVDEGPDEEGEYDDEFVPMSEEDRADQRNLTLHLPRHPDDDDDDDGEDEVDAGAARSASVRTPRPPTSDDAQDPSSGACGSPPPTDVDADAEGGQAAAAASAPTSGSSPSSLRRRAAGCDADEGSLLEQLREEIARTQRLLEEDPDNESLRDLYARLKAMLRETELHGGRVSESELLELLALARRNLRKSGAVAQAATPRGAKRDSWLLAVRARLKAVTNRPSWIMN